MSDLTRLQQLAGLKPTTQPLNESAKAVQKPSPKKPVAEARKSFKDYLHEATQDMKSMQTIGTDRASAIDSIQARLGPNANKQMATSTFDKMKGTGTIKQNGNQMEMPAMGDEDFKSAIGEDSDGVDSPTGWNRISGPTIDVTGDDLGDACDQYSLTLVKKFEANPGDRKTLVYMNNDKTVKMVATPYWDAANGETYSITVYQNKVVTEKAAFATYPSRKGMFDGKTKAEIRKERTKVKAEMKSLEDAGKPVTKTLRTKLAQVDFALRAKNDWGKAK